MTLKELPKYIPFFFAVALIQVYSLKTEFTPTYYNVNGVLVSTVVISAVNYAKIGCSIVLIFILAQKTIWRYLFILLILISFTPLIKFSNHVYSFGIGSLHIELISTGLLISHLLLNPEIFSDFNALFPTSDEALKTKKEIILKQDESRIKKYEQKFKSKSENDLKGIVNGNAYVAEAVEAAKRLLKQF